MICHLKVFLERDCLNSIICVSKEVKEQDDITKLDKIIKKLHNDDWKNQSIFVDYLKSEELSMFHNNKWQITDCIFTLKTSELIEEYKKGPKDIKELHSVFNHVHESELGSVVFKLQIQDKLMRAEGNKHKLVDNPSPVKNIKDIPATEIESEKQVKNCRKIIIDKATINDISEDGFKKEFLETLSDDESEYLGSINSFKIKLMISEIRKKPTP